MLRLKGSTLLHDENLYIWFQSACEDYTIIVGKTPLVRRGGNNLIFAGDDTDIFAYGQLMLFFAGYGAGVNSSVLRALKDRP